MSATASRLAPLLVALLSLAACHDVTEPVSEGAGPLQVLERPVTTDHDTVDSQLGGALRLAIYDSAGRRLPNAAVSIRAVSGDTTRGTENAFAVFSHDSWWQVGTGPYSFAPWFITDSVGEVRIPIRLGTLAGRIGARVAVVGLETSSTFTVWLTVHPGAPAGLRLLPQDTALYVGHTYPLRANVIDRYANARPEQPTVVADSAAATATSAGVVTGQAIGRAKFRATWGSFTTTAWASVVPHGNLAAVASYPTRLIRMNLDGSDLHSVETTINYIAWAPSGTRLAVQDYGGPNPYCYYEGYAAVMDTLGVEKQLLPVNDCGNFEEAQRAPRFSADEQWVYFERARYASGAGGFGSTISRIHPDDLPNLGGVRWLPSGMCRAWHNCPPGGL